MGVNRLHPPGGVLTLRDLIVADPKTRVSEIMNPNVIYANSEKDLTPSRK